MWATLVYDPVAHWVWGVGGILRNLGALDFAGGTVVHITAGFSALAFAMVIGTRSGFGKARIEPHNIPFTVLGAGLLWMGWFGFNGGSALAANGLAVNALVTTNTAAAAAGARLDAVELARQQAERAGHRHRRGRRAGSDHAGRRLRHPPGGRDHRRAGGADQLLCHPAAPEPESG